MDPLEPTSRLSRRQFGVVTRHQLLGLGWTQSSIRTALTRGLIWRILPGVLVVASVPICWEQRRMAVTLWGGPITLASHDTAARLLGLVDPTTGPVEVTADHSLRSRAGVVAHRTRLEAEDISRKGSIPCTSPARTLVDLCHRRGDDLSERALDRALRVGCVSMDQLEGFVERAASRYVRGSATLRRHLSVRGEDQALSESDLEDLFGRVMSRGGLPIGVRQALRPGVKRGRVDIHYPDHNLVVELDGRKWHSGRRELKRDRHYDNALVVSGTRVLRFDWEQLTRDERYVLGVMARALGVHPSFGTSATTTPLSDVLVADRTLVVGQ